MVRWIIVLACLGIILAKGCPLFLDMLEQEACIRDQKTCQITRGDLVDQKWCRERMKECN